MSTILVVCTGNVCRSPYLERSLAHALPDVTVHSAGTMALAGDDIEPRVKAALTARGRPAEDFVSRQLLAPMVAAADLTIVASREHQRQVLRLEPRAMRRTFTLRELADALTADAPVHEPTDGLPGVVRRAVALRGRGRARSEDEVTIPDPYGRADAVIEAMVAHIDAALPPIIRSIGAATAAAKTTDQ